MYVSWIMNCVQSITFLFFVDTIFPKKKTGNGTVLNKILYFNNKKKIGFCIEGFFNLGTTTITCLIVFVWVRDKSYNSKT